MTKTISGRQVVAKMTKYGLSAVTYANRTQAERKAAELRKMNGWQAEVIGRRPFYVAVVV